MKYVALGSSVLLAVVLAGCGISEAEYESSGVTGQLWQEQVQDEEVSYCPALSGCDATHTGASYDGCCPSTQFCGHSGVCTADKAEGSSCNRNGQCQTGLCYQGVCRVPQCSSDTDCGANAYCDNRICKTLIVDDGGGGGGTGGGTGGGNGYICHADPNCAFCNLDGNACLIFYNTN